MWRVTRIWPVAAGVVVAVLGGCGAPDGVDGDLTGAWSGMPEPESFVPAAETCHNRTLRHTATLAGYDPLPCDEGHVRETVHVGELAGEAAERTSPPPVGSPEHREAYRACDEAAADYLGADFRHGRIRLGVVVPSRRAWDGGARWFRCDVSVFKRTDHGDRAEHITGSLRDALAGPSEYALSCFDTTEKEDAEGRGLIRLHPVACDSGHTAEFAGVWTAPDVAHLSMSNSGDAERVHRGCRGVVGDYVGVPADTVRFRTGTIATPIPTQEWDAGDRGFRCYVWRADPELAESVAGAGEEGLPILTG